jgi:hypothetical protein
MSPARIVAVAGAITTEGDSADDFVDRSAAIELPLLEAALAAPQVQSEQRANKSTR